MKKIYDETYNSVDGRSSRNVWYTDVEMHQDNEYGSLADLTEMVQKDIIDTILHDLDKAESVSETNWYFYDSTTIKDANEETIRTSLMVKYKKNHFYAHFNISDHSFALNFEEIQKQVKLFETNLNRLLKKPRA
ncbi:hypothetical protein [Listeria fleischmannii]|nr:hypothetical protein [Listeria fleischmannii]EMG27153.1 hypothetical protein LFLEISCH_12650 [Listeria fleischmannii subsp. fleischmannii LU2006-1]